MFYNRFPYTIFDQSTIDEYIRQQQEKIKEEQHHIEQQNHITEMRKAVADYCRAAKKVSPEYQRQAINVCLEEIMLQAIHDGLSFTS